MSWTLSNGDGAHYVGVGVADDTGNRSHLDGRSLDFASLVVPGAKVAPFQPVPYLVAYHAGVNVAAKLVLATGESSLFTFYAGAIMDPITLDARQAEFTAANAGTYLFMVRDQPEATFDLASKPGGDPRRAPTGGNGVAELGQGRAPKPPALKVPWIAGRSP